MSATETNLDFTVKEIVRHGELAEKYHQRSGINLARSVLYQQLAGKERLAGQSQYNVFVEEYGQEIRRLSSNWAKSRIPRKLSPQVAALLCKVLRELWGVKRDRKLPETMETIVEGLLLVAIKSLQTELAK